MIPTNTVAVNTPRVTSAAADTTTHGLSTQDERPALDRWCKYCGTRKAEIFDVDGDWCTVEHQVADRGSEITVWRRAVGGVA